MIASGGDDNALVVSLIKVSGNGLSVAAKGSCLSAHATEITGIFLHKRLCYDNIRFISYILEIVFWLHPPPV